MPAVLKEKRFVIPSSRVKNGSVDVENRTLEATFSDDSVDRDGEVVLPSAFEERLPSFMKNPVVLWMHDAWNTPIGHVAEINIGDKSVDGKVQFRPEGDSTLSDDVFSAYASGTLSSFSIGFRVFDMDPAERDEETEAIVKPPTITDAELFELSAVTIPANTNAVAKSATFADMLKSGLARYLKATGEVLPDGGGKLFVPTSGAGGAPVYAAAPSDLAVLERAKELVDELVVKVARKARVGGEELEALKALRLAFVGSSRSLLTESDQEAEVANQLTEALAACDGLLSGGTA